MARMPRRRASPFRSRSRPAQAVAPFFGVNPKAHLRCLTLHEAVSGVLSGEEDSPYDTNRHAVLLGGEPDVSARQVQACVVGELRMIHDITHREALFSSVDVAEGRDPQNLPVGPLEVPW
jgi:hypothetical protein